MDVSNKFPAPLLVSSAKFKQANYVQTLHQLLEATLAPDTSVIKAVRVIISWVGKAPD